MYYVYIYKKINRNFSIKKFIIIFLNVQYKAQRIIAICQTESPNKKQFMNNI